MRHGSSCAGRPTKAPIVGLHARHRVWQGPVVLVQLQRWDDNPGSARNSKRVNVSPLEARTVSTLLDGSQDTLLFVDPPSLDFLLDAIREGQDERIERISECIGESGCAILDVDRSRLDEKALNILGDVTLVETSESPVPQTTPLAPRSLSDTLSHRLLQRGVEGFAEYASRRGDVW